MDQSVNKELSVWSYSMSCAQQLDVRTCDE